MPRSLTGDKWCRPRLRCSLYSCISGVHRAGQDVPGRGPLQVPCPPARQVRLRVQPRRGQASALPWDPGHNAGHIGAPEAGDDDLGLSEARRGPNLEDSEA